MNSSVPSPASPRENTVSFYNGKENVASTVRRRSLAAEVQPTMNLKAATYGDNLKITVCLISSFTNSCSGNRNWYSATWGLSIRLPSRSWKYRNASLGVLMDCKKNPKPHHPLALSQLHCSQTNLSQTMWGTTLAMGAGAHSHYTEPLTLQGDEKHRTTIKHWLRHISQRAIRAFCKQ